MKSYDELKAEMEAIQQQMVEAKKNERANALKEVKRLCKEFGFTAGMLKGALAEGRKKKFRLANFEKELSDSLNISRLWQMHQLKKRRYQITILT